MATIKQGVRDLFGYPEFDQTGTSSSMARNWWMFALRGVLSIVFGIIAIYIPGSTLLALVIVFAAYMMIDGVLMIVSAMLAARHWKRWVALVLGGLLSIAVGVASLVWPDLTLLAFVLLAGAWALVTGVLTVGAAARLRISHGRFWLVASGALSIVLGLVLLVSPAIGAVVLSWWIGAYALVSGSVLLVLAFQMRSHRPIRSPTVPRADETPAASSR